MNPPPYQDILVVEDDTIIAELLVDILNEEPAYRARTLMNGAEVAPSLRQECPHLILLDLNLPGLDGTQVYDLLQADPETQAIPVLFVTANTHDPRLTERGITDIIPKPFDLTSLLAAVALALKTA